MFDFTVYCQAQQSGARLANRDVAPVAALQSWLRERQTYVMVLDPEGPPCKFGTHDLHLLLGVSKYVSDRARYFSSTSDVHRS